MDWELAKTEGGTVMSESEKHQEILPVKLFRPHHHSMESWKVDTRVIEKFERAKRRARFRKPSDQILEGVA